MSTIRQFSIVIRVEPDGLSANRYQVFTQVSPIADKTTPHTVIAVQKFANEKAAHEFGLQKAREWIEHAQGGN